MIYFGITIGPIFETLNLTSSPAGLWCASYMFSDITYKICLKLEKEFSDKNLKIYSPYFPLKIKNDTQLDKCDCEKRKPKGVGIYHDRIIFSCGIDSEQENEMEYTEFSDKLKRIISEVKKRTAVKIFAYLNNGKYKDELKEENIKLIEKYLSIQFLSIKNIPENSNIILEISEYLDALELNHIPSGEGKMELKNFFYNEKKGAENQGKNELVKETEYIKDIISYIQGLDSVKIKENVDMKTIFPLLKEYEGNPQIRTLVEISSYDEIEDSTDIKQEYEKTKLYFVLIQADGDNVGKLIRKLKNEEIEEFSKICMEFSKEAADKVHKFGGVTIYAGGDDLLFIVPVFANPKLNNYSKENNFLNLCCELNELFIDELKKFIENISIEEKKDLNLSLSFGITLCYHKEPLYEVLSNTQNLLFGKAKENRDTKAVELRKHSGGNISFNLKNNSEIEKKLLYLINNKDSEDKVNSILYHLNEFEKLYNMAFSESKDEENGKIKLFFKNMFDRHIDEKDDENEDIEFKNEYVKAIYELAIAHWKERKSETGKNEFSPAREFATLLKFAKFFGEE